MFKKIIAAAAIAASAAFATWDYFPVQEAGKGTLHGGLYYDWHHEWSQAGLNLGARYTVIQNLELSLQGWGYQFWSEVDCQGCTNGGDGLRDLTIGGRYQITPMVSGFIDLRLPIGNDDDGVNGHPPSNSEVSIYLGGQFSMPIQGVQGLSFGTEAGLDWGFEHDNYERGLEIHIAGEMDFAVPNQIFIPYLGLKFKLSSPKIPGKTTRVTNGALTTAATPSSTCGWAVSSPSTRRSSWMHVSSSVLATWTAMQPVSMQA